VAKKAPLKLASCANTISVSGTTWSVEDEDELARLVGRILLGHFLHVENILKKLKPGFKLLTAKRRKRLRLA
jgi:hypothetical protein